MSGQWTIILVFSTSHALQIERLLASSGVSSKLIPVPRQLGSNCGVCLRIDRTDKETAERLLQYAAIDVDGLRDWQ